MLSDSDLNGYDTFIHIFMFTLVLTMDLHDKLLPQVRKFKRKQGFNCGPKSQSNVKNPNRITFLTYEVSLAHPLPQGVAKPLLKLKDKILSFQEVMPSPSTQCKQVPEQGSCLLVTAVPHTARAGRFALSTREDTWFLPGLGLLQTFPVPLCS